MPISAQDAIDHLYRTTVVEKKSTSTTRLSVLANLCVQELEKRGIVAGQSPNEGAVAVDQHSGRFIGAGSQFRGDVLQTGRHVHSAPSRLPPGGDVGVGQQRPAFAVGRETAGDEPLAGQCSRPRGERAG